MTATGFYTFQSFIQPPTIYRYDTTTGKQEIFAQPKTPFDSSRYELKQVFYKSKDGTRIPMFIAGPKNAKLDGTARMLMTGYGGFDLSETPAWNALYAAWMEKGGWFALPNLRAGGEYGEAWHKAGMFDKKQNVFDDFYAAAEYLIANKYTSARHFAITGRSNGGLLMGAAMTQRPDLFWSDLVRLSLARHAPLPEVPLRTPLDDRIWHSRKATRLRIPASILPLPERQAQHTLSRHHVLHRR